MRPLPEKKVWAAVMCKMHLSLRFDFWHSNLSCSSTVPDPEGEPIEKNKKTPGLNLRTQSER